jgi:hypothetical protein
MSTTAAPRPAYWLHCKCWGEMGPYTKEQAREIVERHRGMKFHARREGEITWQRARRRLWRRRWDLANEGATCLFLAAAVAYITGMLYGEWFALGTFAIMACGSLGYFALVRTIKNPDSGRSMAALKRGSRSRSVGLRTIEHSVPPAGILGGALLVTGLAIMSYNMTLSWDSVDLASRLIRDSGGALAEANDRMFRVIGGIGVAVAGSVVLAFSGGRGGRVVR